MPKSNEQHLRACLSLADDMLSLAEEADRERTDDACALLWGLLRDMAYRLRRATLEECAKHGCVGEPQQGA
jgi:hypothetical protein